MNINQQDPVSSTGQRERRRVVVTGMGAVSAFGLGVEPLMAGLRSGRSAVVDLSEQCCEKMPNLTCLVGAPLTKQPDAKEIARKHRRTMGPTAIMSWFACQEAVRQAQILPELMTSGRLGISFGSTTGSVASLEAGFSSYFRKSYLREITSGNFFQIMSHTCAANMAHAFGVCGRVLAPNAACASSTLALGLGFEAVRDGAQELMLCGGADELHVIVTGAFDMVQASSCRFNDRPTETPRPFDEDRDGTVCGEGAGAMVLESLDSARARGAPILAEVLGFATAADGQHLAQPRSVSIVQCLDNALDSAGLRPENVDYINAHGTGTVLGDRAEAQAIAEVFGAAEANRTTGREVLVSSLKGHLGHTLGASGALELIATLEMMAAGELIPTRNLERPGEGCTDIEHVRRLEHRPVKTILKNSFAFGGINTVIALKRYDE